MKNSCDFMDHVFAGTASARVPFGFIRAINKASEMSGITSQQIIFSCLTSEYNLNKVIDSFDENDLKWIHEKQADAMAIRNSNRAIVSSAEQAEAVGERMIAEAHAAMRSVGK